MPVEERGLVGEKGEHVRGKKSKVTKQGQRRSSRWIEVIVLHRSTSSNYICFLSAVPSVHHSGYSYTMPFCESGFHLCFQHMESKTSVGPEKSGMMTWREFLQALILRREVSAFLQGTHLFSVLQC